MPGPDFDTIVAGYYEPLCRFAIGLTRSEADACDLAQQTLYWEDCSCQAIAGILDVPIGTVKSRMARGLAQLKHIFAGNYPARNRSGGQHE